MSIHIENEPVPKANPESWPLISWPVRFRRHCPPVTAPPSLTFTEVFEGRRSARELETAPLRTVLNLLGYALSPRFVREGDPLGRTRRPSLSSGALHPIETVIVHGRSRRRVLRYDARLHCVELLRVANSDAVKRFDNRCRSILPDASATTLCFIGDSRRVAAAYDNYESLLWRDAGAVLQTVALTATAYRLGFCPLGLLGTDLVIALGLDRNFIVPVGCAVLGFHSTAP